MRFRIEYVSSGDRPYVLARQLEAGSFEYAAPTTLGGAAVVLPLSQPRSLLPDGTPDFSVFAFPLRSKAESAKLIPGQVAELGK